MAKFGTFKFGEELFASSGSTTPSNPDGTKLLRVPWVFQEPSSADVYEFAINPLDATMPAISKTFTTQYTASGKPVTFQGRNQVQTMSFSGTILTEEHLSIMREWFMKEKQVSITDDLGRQYWVYLTSFSPTRDYRPAYPWKHEYTAEATVMSWGFNASPPVIIPDDPEDPEDPEVDGLASSFHLWWEYEEGAPTDIQEAEVVLTVTDEPSYEDLYFWAIQVTFYNEFGSIMGGAHAGLQWHPAYPDHGAVNWGGYSTVTDDELTGTTSSLPSTLSNPNTRDYAWSEGTPYTFRIFPVGGDYWRATVNGTTIRDLYVPNAVRIADVVVWSEVFAVCSAPSSRVQWSDPQVTTEGDDEISPTSMYVAYQTTGDFCTNTNSDYSGGVWRQTTNTTRINSHGSHIP